MQNLNKTKLIAIAITALVLVITLALLLATHLHYSSATEREREWPPADSSELLFANEFVAMGQVAPVDEPTEASEVAQSAPAPEAQHIQEKSAPEAAPEPLVNSQRASSMTVKPAEPKKAAPTKDQLEAEARAKAQKEMSQNISQRVNFGGNTAGGNASGTPESAAGTATSTTGMASASVGGRTMEKWSKPTGRATGTITVKVRVDRQGKVVRADYSSGTGAVASLAAARQSCEQAAMKSQFSVALDGPAIQTGEITYRFK